MKKILIILFLTIPLITYSQLYKSYGLKFINSFDNNGWSHPDTFYSNYHNKVYISNYLLGIYAEGLSNKYASTVFDLGVRFRYFYIEYDAGNITDPAEVNNELTYVHVGITEKLKYETDPWCLYLYGGFKGDIQFHKDVEKDFENDFGSAKPVLMGVTGGIGFTRRVFRFFSITFNLYAEQDITKMVSSNVGKVQLSEFGFQIGFGPYNPATK